MAVPKHPELDTEKKQALADAVTELPQLTTRYEVDAKKALATSPGFARTASLERQPARGAQGVRLCRNTQKGIRAA
jgi:hypothetical protein